MSGIVNQAGSKSGAIRQSDVLNSNRYNWAVIYRTAAGDSAWVDNDVSPTILKTIDLLQDSNIQADDEGHQPSTGTNPLVIEVLFDCQRSYNGTTSYYYDLYIAGGGFGTGWVNGDNPATITASKFCVGRINQNIPDNGNQHYGFKVVDMNPGTGPSYQILRVGTPNVTYTHSAEAIIIYEVGEHVGALPVLP